MTLEVKSEMHKPKLTLNILLYIILQYLRENLSKICLSDNSALLFLQELGLKNIYRYNIDFSQIDSTYEVEKYTNVHFEFSLYL